MGGVRFTEGRPADAEVIRPVRVEISRQNSSLAKVKESLAAQVRSAGGDALIEFRYGQRAHSWWQNLLPKWDTESWHGEGLAARWPERPAHVTG